MCGNALCAAEEHEHDGLLGVEAVFGLVEDYGLWTVEDGVGDFGAAVGGKAVHEGGGGLCEGHQVFTWKGLKMGARLAASCSMPMLVQTSV